MLDRASSFLYGGVDRPRSRNGKKEGSIAKPLNKTELKEERCLNEPYSRC
jgi:hypothetical protein